MKTNQAKKIREKLEDLKIDVGLQILELRLIKDKTQDDLAELIGTQQPSIARVERGATIPSLTFLNRIAIALGTELIPPKFALVEENEILHRTHSVLAESNQFYQYGNFKQKLPTTEMVSYTTDEVSMDSRGPVSIYNMVTASSS